MNKLIQKIKNRKSVDNPERNITIGLSIFTVLCVSLCVYILFNI